jgi:DNA-binding beta-propeller fold protein YncE
MTHLTNVIPQHVARRAVATLAAASSTLACLLLLGTASASAASPPGAPTAIRMGLHSRIALARPPRAVILGATGSFRNPIAPAVSVGPNPVAVAVDASSDTIYVGNSDNTMSVINGAICDASNHTGCDQTPAKIPAGSGGVDSAVNPATHTVYVANIGGNTVPAIDTHACNAQHPGGCSATPPAITVGNSPDGLAIDTSTNTVYVSNFGDNTISVINGATCDATNHSGCGQVPPTTDSGSGPSVPALDEATHTLYVPNANDGTVSVINTAACNATRQSGCDQKWPTIGVGPNPFSIAVDPGTDTVYVTSAPLGEGAPVGSVYVINGATCNSGITGGCQVRAKVTVGSVPIGVAVVSATKTVYVVNEEDSSVSIFSAATCNARYVAGCREPVHTLSVGRNGGYLVVNEATHTVYVSNQSDNTVSVLNTLACSAPGWTQCRIAAPTIAVGGSPQGIAADTATGTVYEANLANNDLSVINAQTCSADHVQACERRWPTVRTGPFPDAVAVNERTDTIYTANADVGANYSGDSVSVINGATCNSNVTAGCGQSPTIVPVGMGPAGLAVNPATDTIYVANILDNTVSVINGATCDGTDHSGCASNPPVIHVGNGPTAVAVDIATDTVYVLNGNDGTVSVINGSTCNGSDQSGCAGTPPTFTTNSPAYVALAQATDTIYVANYNADFISVINGATCNHNDMSGCASSTPMTTNSSTSDLGIDQDSGTVFADASFYGSEVLVLDGATCNAHATSGCGEVPDVVPVGGWPGDIAAIPGTSTGYVIDNVDSEVSFFGYGQDRVYP